MVDAEVLAKTAGSTVDSVFDAAPEPEARVQHDDALAIPGLAAGVAGTARPAGSAGDPLGGTSVTSEVSGLLASRQGRGAALPAQTSDAMSAAFGRDFSGVRVHHDEQANDIAGRVQAEAFTHGSDLYFAKGAYDPGSSSGTHLLAHELAHVAQQQDGRHGGAAAGLTVGRADDPAEAAAEATAAQVVTSLRRQAARVSVPRADAATAPADPLGSLRRRSAVVAAQHVAAEHVVIRRDLQKDWAKGSKRFGSRSKLLKSVDQAVLRYARNAAAGAVAATRAADLNAIVAALDLWGKADTSKRSTAAAALLSTVQAELVKLKPKPRPKRAKKPTKQPTAAAPVQAQDEPLAAAVEVTPAPAVSDIVAKAVAVEDMTAAIAGATALTDAPAPIDLPAPATGPAPVQDGDKASALTPAVATPAVATPAVLAPVVPKTGKALFEETVAPGAPAGAAEGIARMDALRVTLQGMTRSDKDLIAGDDALMAKARTYIGPKEYISLLAAVGMYRKKTKGGVSESMHMTGAEADTFIQTNITGFLHLAPYIQAAVQAGKKGDGFVATLGEQDWNKVYELEFPTEAIGSSDETTTNAFASTRHRDEPAILHHDRGTRSTAIHESMHRYATDDVNQTWGFGFNEGVTEYFTRLLTTADGTPAKDGGTARKNYQANWLFISDMLRILGADETAQQTQLAEINFNGKTDVLKKQFVKAAKAKSMAAPDIENQWKDFDEAIREANWAVARTKLPAA